MFLWGWISVEAWSFGLNENENENSCGSFDNKDNFL